MRSFVALVFASTPAAPAPNVSAQTEQEAKLGQRVQLALIPEYLQQRIPGHNYKRPPRSPRRKPLVRKNTSRLTVRARASCSTGCSPKNASSSADQLGARWR
jgi:hypothetical protein